jgi:hypothetical protein
MKVPTLPSYYGSDHHIWRLTWYLKCEFLHLNKNTQPTRNFRGCSMVHTTLMDHKGHQVITMGWSYAIRLWRSNYWAWLNKLLSVVSYWGGKSKIDWVSVLPLHLVINGGGFYRRGWRPWLLLRITCGGHARSMCEMEAVKEDEDWWPRCFSFNSCWNPPTLKVVESVELRSMNRIPFWLTPVIPAQLR